MVRVQVSMGQQGVPHHTNDKRTRLLLVRRMCLSIMNGQQIKAAPNDWAMEEIKQIRDKDLIPDLESLLEHEMWEVRYAAAIALSHMGESSAIPHLVSATEHVDYEYRDVIRDGLISIGKSDISSLIDYLRSESNNLMIIKVLGILKNPGAISVLSQILLNEHNGWAASSLGEIGGPDAISALKQALQVSDRRVRFMATQALGEVGIPAVPILVEALDNSEWWVRKEAADFLGRIGNEAALNKLEEIRQDDPHNQVRDAAESACRKLNRNASILIHKLETNNQIREELARRPPQDTLPEHDYNYILARAELLQEDDVELINTLGEIGDEAAIPTLAQALIFEESNQTVQEAVKRVYSKTIAPGITDFDYPRVKQIVGDAPKIRRAAAAAMGAIGGEKAVLPLIQALKDDDEWVREAAAVALGKIGDERAVPDLVEALENNHGEVRQAIEESLKQCKSSNSIPRLVKPLGSGNWTIRKPAEEILLEMGPAAIKPLCEAYRNSNDSEEQYRIVKTLGKIGEREATPLLVEALESRDISVSHAAVQALAQIGTIDRGGFGKLVELFNDREKSYLHPETAVALGQLAPSISDENTLESARKALWQRRFSNYKENVFTAYEKVVTSLTTVQVRELPQNDKHPSSASATKTSIFSHIRGH